MLEYLRVSICAFGLILAQRVLTLAHRAGADPGGQGMVSAAGIHLDGSGKPTEIQISQCWVFNHARGIYMTVRAQGHA